MAAEPLSEANAHAFARMIHAGAPAEEAAKYFVTAHATREDILAAAQDWALQPDVVSAYEALSGGQKFEDFTDRDERRRYALEKHYDEMAFVLYSTNYAQLTGTDKTKADTCREALEKKLAGLAGKDPLMDFWTDLLRTKKPQMGDSDEVSLQ